jgi:hypothetical protein
MSPNRYLARVHAGHTGHMGASPGLNEPRPPNPSSLLAPWVFERAEYCLRLARLFGCWRLPMPGVVLMRMLASHASATSHYRVAE